ncbi:protein of unknown function [Algoriphagus alkaliphilus]|uniref:DUF4402 domain-containing protein n=1 Tax=Algoriphagus alkaliphilus TaxID=279824 RepID=A0A1G5W4Y7_9BACT|nr:DUF4402 domain-containing protein [Algoriphagus alkaliphilus]MBA4300514.1 DUF4402 domain-containing protein [Cyclobacterium sp.]SDA53183.1 protein of unknown function [Algoriphagus alkaliphilus]
MKTILKSVLTLGLVVGLGFAANAQKTATAPASATVLADLTITLDATQNEIDFGNLSANTPGVIVHDANGPAGNANTGSNTQVARFDLAGANSAVTVSYDPTVTLSNTDPTPATMTMTPEVVGAALATDQATATAVARGSQVTLAGTTPVYFLWVGGTIPALASQATGTYSGTFNIEVEYN